MIVSLLSTVLLLLLENRLYECIHFSVRHASASCIPIFVMSQVLYPVLALALYPYNSIIHVIAIRSD